SRCGDVLALWPGDRVRKLDLVEAGVEAAALDQLAVPAAFDHPALVHYVNDVRVGYRSQPMGDHDRRSAASQLLQGHLDGLLRFAVERRSGLIEENDRSVLQEGAGQ